MSKPVNFSYSNTLTSTQQPIVKQKGTTNNTGTTMSASSNGVMAGFSRPNVNVGHIGPGESPMNNLYEYNLNFRGPFGKAYPMKHWRRQLSVNGKSGRSAALVSLSERPGGTVFRGYVAPGTTCACDPSANNLYVTFDNKFLQSTSHSIKPHSPEVLANTTNNKVENNGFIQIGALGANGSYQIQTGVYETKPLCYSKEKDARKRVRSVTKLSKSYFSSTKQYLKNKGNLFEQKQSINPINIQIQQPIVAVAVTVAVTVAVGYGTNTIAYSYDGITWTGLGKTIFSSIGRGVAWNGTLWVAVGYGTNSIATSPDGITWTGLGKSPFSFGGYGVAWNGTLWVAVGGGTNTIATSPDGITWTGLGNSIFSSYGRGVAWNGTLWVAVGYGTNTIATSYDGITWTGLGDSIFSTRGYGVAWNGTLWVAVGEGTNSIATSYDGITWTGLGNSIFSSGFGVAWNGTLWVAVGYGTNTIATSPDGITWTGLGNSIFTYGFGVAWNGTLWVAVGFGTNSIATSPDGITWTGLGNSIFSQGNGVAGNTKNYTNFSNDYTNFSNDYTNFSNDYTNFKYGQGSTQYYTQNCTSPFQTGRDCHNITYYNPNNRQFAKQGAVDSSTRLLKLNVDTITKNGNSFRSAWGDAAANAGRYQGESFNPTFIKSKYTRTLAWRRMGDRFSCKGCSGPSQTLSSFWTAVR